MRKFLESNKWLVWLLAGLNILFLVYVVIWSWNTRLHYDDLHFLWRVRDMGVWGFLKYFYMTRSGRYVLYGVYGITTQLMLCGLDYRILPILYLFVGYGLTWLAVKDWKLSQSRILWLNVVLLSYNLYVFTAIDFAVFTWICAMEYYLYAPCMLLFMRYLNKENLKTKHWMLLGLLTLILGGGHEAYTPVLLFLMLCNGLYWWKKEDWNIKRTWNNPVVKRIIILAITLLALWVVVLIAPGNYARLDGDAEIEGFHTPTTLVGFVLAYAECIGMFGYFQAFYALYYLILFFIMVYLGSRSNVQLPVSKSKINVFVICAYLIFLVVSSTPMAVIYGGFGIQRLYLPAIYALIVTIMVLGFFVGRNNKLKNNVSLCVSFVGIVLLALVLLISYKTDIPMMKSYSKSVDERIELLQNEQQKGRNDTLFVEPYPCPTVPDAKYNILKLLGKQTHTHMSAIYYFSDTGVMPNEYEYHLRKVYDLNYDFILLEK